VRELLLDRVGQLVEVERDFVGEKIVIAVVCLEKVIVGIKNVRVEIVTGTKIIRKVTTAIDKVVIGVKIVGIKTVRIKSVGIGKMIITISEVIGVKIIAWKIVVKIV
jgi:hypothetical protein